MASIIEDRVLKYLQENALDGRILIKLDDLAAALGETKNPVYRALNSLVKKKKIKSENRSRMGLEITLIKKPTNGSQSDLLGSETQVNEFSETEAIPFDELLSQIRLLNLNQLRIVKDFVDLNIIKKRSGDNNE
ncbi:hypothetical protein PTH_2169 [Pelotomaculum thermopropionicum SI]|uniref:Uncharacterized protein n=1 Tax=Pelotomaculum thermopropionicum (strain DSM 13744 / JCM 10971 / SI) TaxID=370438 RepID=A5D086_PELTS|nr:hypothetical protein PTH_2169 [Pelotomaculum thermopropionicum SI]